MPTCLSSLRSGRECLFSGPAFPAGLQGVKFPHIRKFISVYTKKYFRICGNFFSCARKFLSFRTAQNFRSEGAQISFRKKIYFLAEEKIFSCGRKFSSVRTKILRRSEVEKSTFEGGKIFLRKKINFRT